MLCMSCIIEPHPTSRGRSQTISQTLTTNVIMIFVNTSSKPNTNVVLRSTTFCTSLTASTTCWTNYLKDWYGVTGYCVMCNKYIKGIVYAGLPCQPFLWNYFLFVELLIVFVPVVFDGTRIPRVLFSSCISCLSPSNHLRWDLLTPYKATAVFSH